MAIKDPKNVTPKAKYFMISLAIFVLIGSGLFFVNNDSVSKPSLNAGYKFFLGLSDKSLDLSTAEVYKLNRCFQNNREVVDKATLVIVTEGRTISGKEGLIKNDTKLKYKVILESKGGMKFTPQMSYCTRKKLVTKIVYNFDRGSKAMAVYMKDPIFKGRTVEIKDM
ncbi:hypothetical protein [Maridesulfovibrio frigidus]|uniref:hypothetical protein n=1 Tax=Maridesulfovibrio frigidus TaxID=340956 RepID=UPI0004E1B7A4|nr:hypothetical protein [Maridesulfovibrio frigidus]